MDRKRVSELSNYLKFFVGKRLLKQVFSRLGLPRMKGTVLDVGSGREPFSAMLGALKVVTLDYDAKRGPMSVGSCTALPFKDSAFDSVICTEVLEHVSEPGEALSEMQRVMKPGSQIYLTAPMTWCLHYEPYDFYRYTKYGLRHLMEKSGFKVITLEPVGGLYTFLSMRFGEFFYNMLNKVFFFLPRAVRIYFILPFVYPIAILLYYASHLLDRLSPRDVFTWVVVGERVE